MKKSEQALCTLRTKCRVAENYLLVSLRRFKKLLPDAGDIEITPDADLTYSSLDEQPSTTKAPNKDAIGVTPSHRGTRLPSDASTAAVWSGEEGRQV